MSWAELARSLGILAERPVPGHAAVSEALGLRPPSREEHTELFVLSLVPYASVYLGPEGRIGGEARATIAGFWRAVGVEPVPEPDHLTSLLGLYGALVDRTGEAAGAHRVLVGEAVRALFWEHLASWLPPYVIAVRRHGGAYVEWAELLASFLVAEARRLGPPAREIIHFRDVPDGPDADSGDLVEALLAPIRSGFILTRHDLASLAAHLGLGLRMGERRFALSELLAQDRDRLLEALAGLVSSFAEDLDSFDSALDPALDHWRRRTRATTRVG